MRRTGAAAAGGGYTFANANLSTNPASPNGGAYLKVMEDLATGYQSGSVTDLDGALQKADQQIDAGTQLNGN
jgi:multiple sugar transport system substrate-binding protein